MNCYRDVGIKLHLHLDYKDANDTLHEIPQVNL